MKRKFLYLTAILTIGLTRCNPKIDFSKIVPDNVDKFATGFISEIHKGNIDSCLTLVLPEMNNETGKQFLTNTYMHIRSLTIDSFSIVNARKTRMIGDKAHSNYGIDYEYKVGDKFIYFTFGISEQVDKLTITAFDGRIVNNSIANSNTFNLKDKGFLHYMFLVFSILVPIFIIVTLIFATKSRLEKKWLWIIGILFGFIKFSINWTTGQVALKTINFSILGSGFSKSGNAAPWILSFSIPIVAIIFWYKKYFDERAVQSRRHLDESMNTQINQDQN
jgi:hypothetical protein